MGRLQGITAFVHDAIDDTTSLVERTHESAVARRVGLLRQIDAIREPVEAVDAVRQAGTAGVYGMVRAVNRGVGLLTGAGAALVESLTEGIEPLGDALRTPLRSDAVGTLPWLIDGAQGALNGAVGDRLRDRSNGLDIAMGLRHHGARLPVSRAELAAAFPAATDRVCLFVHGLGCTEWAFSLGAGRFHGDPATTFGTLLEEDFGITPLFLRYNTGLHVSENGRALAELLETLVAEWPVPLVEISLVGHSMGGLVARSAAHHGGDGAWARRLRHLFCIGSPHLGAPLEKATNVLTAMLRSFDAAGTQVPAEILNGRSAGVKDLRFGYLVDEEWRGRDPDALLEDCRMDVPFLDGVAYYFVAGTVTRDPTHPVGQFVGDLLVRLPSAAGQAREPTRRIPFTLGRVFGGMNHFHLANHPDVYAQIREWIAAGSGRELPEAR